MSFSRKVKEEIADVSPKIKSCCLYSCLYGMAFASKAEEHFFVAKTTFAENANILNEKFKFLLKKHEDAYTANNREILINKGIIKYFTIAEIAKSVFKCPRCQEHFLRGVFLACGTMNSPEKGHRLDLNFNDFDNAVQFKEYILDNSLKFNMTKRGTKTVLYLKRSEAIEDFLALMGATTSAFEVINSKINSEIRNIANRATNCDSANINKSLNATKKYLEAISYLDQNGFLAELPEHLTEIANARLSFPDASLAELGARLNPPISKSGVHHRLENIYKIYETKLN